MGHLNGILARVGENLNNNFQKSQMPGGCQGGGMLKLRFDRYITLRYDSLIQRLTVSPADKLADRKIWAISELPRAPVLKREQ